MILAFIFPCFAPILVQYKQKRNKNQEYNEDTEKESENSYDNLDKNAEVAIEMQKTHETLKKKSTEKKW